MITALHAWLLSLLGDPEVENGQYTGRDPMPTHVQGVINMEPGIQNPSWPPQDDLDTAGNCSQKKK